MAPRLARFERRPPEVPPWLGERMAKKKVKAKGKKKR